MSARAVRVKIDTVSERPWSPWALILTAVAGGCAYDRVTEPPEPTPPPPTPVESVMDQPRGPINESCPRSGKPIADDSLTEYRGYVVGFCNTHCRDDFAAHVEERPADRAAFDAVIASLEGDSPR